MANLVEQFVHRKLKAERWDAETGRWVRDAKASTIARKRPDEAAALLGYYSVNGAPRKRKGKRKNVPSLMSELGHRKVRELRRADLVAFLEAIVDRRAPITANRVHALLVQMFKWQAGRDDKLVSPMYGVERPGGREQERARALTAEEIKAFWAKADTAAMAEPTKLALKLLLVTGQRRGELTHAKWAHFDLDEKIWTIPVELLKSSHSRRENLKPHTVPLSPLAIDLLRRLRALNGDGMYVLPAFADKTKQGHYSDRVLSRAVRDNEEHFGIEHFTPHDLRRTCRTGLSRLKVEPHIAERVIGHSLGKMLNTYDVHDPVEEKRAALEKWSAHLRAIVNQKGDATSATYTQAA